MASASRLLFEGIHAGALTQRDRHLLQAQYCSGHQKMFVGLSMIVEHTDIELSWISSLNFRSIYFESTMPAGQSWPPHPSDKSSWSLRGGERRPSKSTEDTPATLCTGDWTRSSLMPNKPLLSSSLSILEVVALSYNDVEFARHQPKTEAKPTSPLYPHSENV